MLFSRRAKGPPRNESSHRGRANGREARREDEDVCGEYDESEQRSIAAVQPAECRGHFVAGPKARGALPAAAVLLGASTALAHDPGLSRLAIVVEDRSVTATLSIAAEHRSLMEKAAGPAWALEALEVVVDGEAAPAEWLGSHARERETLEVVLRFPTRDPDRLQVRSRMLAWLPAGHRQVAVASRPDGARLAAAVLSRGSDRLECALETGGRTEVRPGLFAFVGLGAEHIVEGPDHLLFLIALFLGRRSLLDGLKVITAFTAAHSVTLALSALELASLPPAVVEPLIAASIIHAGAANLAGRGGVGAGLAFAFGLVHGLGLSYALREAGLGSGWDAALPLLGFNLGVELAQLALAVLVLPWVIRLGPGGVFSRRLAPVLSGAIVLCGAWWLFERTLLS